MAARNIAIRLSIEDAEKVRAGLMAIGADGKSALAALETGAARSAPAMRQIETAANDTGRGMQRFGQVMGQAGYQVQDFAVQVSSGQSALVAFGQQAPQLLGVFGTGGAIAGAVLTVGVLATQLLMLGDNAETSAKQAEQNFRSVEQSQKDLKAAIEEVSKAYMTQAERAAQAAAAARGATEATLLQNQSWLVQRNDASSTELLEAERKLARLEEYSRREEAMRAGMRRRGELVPEGEAATERGNLFEARTNVQGLRADLDRTSARIQEVNTALGRLRNAGVTGPEMFGPEAPAGITATVSTLRAELDKAGAARQQYADRVIAINARLASGELEAAEAARLTTAAEKARDEALKKIAESGGAAAAARRAETQAAKEQREEDQLRAQVLGARAEAEYRYSLFVEKATEARSRSLITEQQYRDALERNNPLTIEAARIVEQVRTPAEKYAEQLDRLRVLLDAGKLSQDQFNKAAAALDPATKNAEEAAKRHAQAVESANRQVTDNIVRYSADTFADLLDKNGKGWKGMLETFESTFRRTMARIAAEAVLRPIVAPIVQQMGLGGTFGSALAVAGGGLSQVQTPGSVPVTNGQGSLMGWAQQGSQAYSMYDKATSGLNMFGPGYDWTTNTYVGGFDRAFDTGVGQWLNTPTATVSAATAQGLGNSAYNAVNAASYANGGWMGGGAGAIEAGNAVTGATSGATTGTMAGTIGGGVAAIGGAYAAYQGLERGGVGGYTQAAGGAAMAGMGAYAAIAGSMASVPVYGWIAAAALMVIGAMLPGQKPSDMTGTATMATLDNSLTVDGLGGKRYSEANRQSATTIARAIDTLAANAGKAAGLAGDVAAAYTVSVGNRDGVKVTGLAGPELAVSEYDEKNVNILMRAATSRLLMMAADQTTNADAASVIRRSGDDPDTILANLEWLKTTYREMIKSAEESAAANTTWAKTLAALNKPFDEVISKAASLGLATEELARKQAQAVADLNKARWDGFNLDLQNMSVTLSQMRGEDLTGEALRQFDLQRTADWISQTAGIRDRGFGDTEVAAFTALFDPIRDIQRTQVQRNASRAYEDSQASLAGLRSSSDARFLRLQGRDAEADAAEYAAQRRAEETALRRQLEDFGVSAQEAAAQLQIFAWETAKGAEAVQQAARDNAAGQAAGVLSSLSDYARSLQTSDAAPGTVLDRLAAAQSQYERTYAAALGGDASAIGSYREAAETWRGLARETYGGGQGYVDAFRTISEGMGRIADLGSDAVTQSFIRQNDRENTLLIVDELRDLKREVANLRRDNALLMATPR